MAQRTVIFNYNVPHGFDLHTYMRDLRFVANDFSELFSDIDTINKTLSNLTSIAVTNPLNNGFIFIGNASNIAVGVAMSGQATITNTGVVTISNAAVIAKVLTGFVVGANTPIVAADTILSAFEKTQAQINALIVGTSPLTTKGDLFTYSAVNTRLPIGANATILMADSATATGNKWIALSSDVTIATTGAVTIANAAVTYAKIQNVTTTRLLGRATAGVGSAEEITLGTNLSFTGTTLNAAATPLALTQNQIAFGDASNLMTSSANLTWIEASRNLTVTGTITLAVSNSANVFYVAQGNVGFWYTGAASTGLLAHQGFGIDFDAGKNLYTMGDVGITNNTHIEVDDVAQTIELTSVSTITASNLAGVGTRMVTASAAGVLATAAVPTNTTIVNDPNWTLLGQTVYGTGASTGAILAGNITVNRQFLSQTGTGAVSAAPIWVRIDAGDIGSGILPANFGGTGISNNAASTLTISGAFATTLTVTGATGVTLPTTGTLATTSQLGYVLSGGTIFVSGGGATYNPADGITYYPRNGIAVAFSTTADIGRIYFPKAGTITECRVSFTQAAGSSQTSTVYLRLNNTTDITVSSVVTNDATFTTFENTGLSQAVNDSTDYVEFKWIAPTWTPTNPTSVTMQWQITVIPT